MLVLPLVSVLLYLPFISCHASIWHPSMLGFNVTTQSFPYDNRPVAPLINYTFEQWWMHGHLDYPPHPNDIFELPAGQNVTAEIGCNKGATSYFASSDGGDIQNGNDPCPGSPPSEYHTTGISDVKGCALAIADKANFSDVQPEDFTVFSINQTCVWSRFTEFSVPSRMPPCSNGKCICAWFWIHSADSGGEQNYMNAFQCNVTNTTSNVRIAESKVPRRCGADPDFNKPLPVPGNCTYGAKQPFYWFQAQRNNMFEGTFAPPFYLDLYGFLDGAQDDIFEDSYTSIPQPNENQTALPVPANLARLPVPDVELLGSNFVVPTGTPTSTGANAGTPLPTASAVPGGQGPQVPFGATCSLKSVQSRDIRRNSFLSWLGVGTYERKRVTKRTLRALLGL